MSSMNWIRWGALAAVLGGVTFMIGDLLYLMSPESDIQPFVTNVAITFILLGLVGLHVLQRENYGLVGRLGFYMFFAGGLTEMVGSLLVALEGSAFESVMVVGFMTVILGSVFYGVAIWRAGILPRWVGVWFIVAPMSPFVVDAFGGSLQGLLWATLGYFLFSRRGEPARQYPRVS